MADRSKEPRAADPDPDGFVGYTLVRAGHAMERAFEAQLAHAGLTPRQFGVLAHLARRPGIGSGQLARLVLVTPQSMGDLIASLESAGLVERERDRGRGRRIGIRLTAKGQQALAAAGPSVAAFEQETRAALGDEGADQLNALLHRVLRAAASRPSAAAFPRQEPPAGEELA